MTLRPPTRCFSEFPAWLDSCAESLRGREVLMYCTGGVRCERASAYLREKGPDFHRVRQLKGALWRCLPFAAVPHACCAVYV
jgi:predicted sulfurtransferase